MKNHKQFKIGIVAWATGDNSFGITKPYLDFFSKFGIVTLILPQQTEVIEDLDLLVLPGGKDVDPKRYGAIPEFFTGHSDVFLEHFDVNVLPKYIKNNTPIFGICRGLQTINVAFNGTLTQHLYNHPYSSERSDKTHINVVNIDNINNIQYLKDIQLPNTFKSNSLHHQAISKLGTGFVDIARTKSFGKSIEAIAHIEKPIIAVQYHPEEIHDEFSINLIKCLLNNNVKQLKLIDKCIC
jgi:putative glutamine amidotransferase